MSPDLIAERVLIEVSREQRRAWVKEIEKRLGEGLYRYLKLPYIPPMDDGHGGRSQKGKPK